ncbi:MAG: hypothetical protein JWP94_1667 [Mucilaginibacter sp.]|nr:hypothetical protein [Mucilaginibacter sp.]
MTRHVLFKKTLFKSAVHLAILQFVAIIVAQILQPCDVKVRPVWEFHAFKKQLFN